MGCLLTAGQDMRPAVLGDRSFSAAHRPPFDSDTSRESASLRIPNNPT